MGCTRSCSFCGDSVLFRYVEIWVLLFLLLPVDSWLMPFNLIVFFLQHEQRKSAIFSNAHYLTKETKSTTFFGFWIPYSKKFFGFRIPQEATSEPHTRRGFTKGNRLRILLVE